jgi:acetoin utilization deacetylase AcuC-like enzyme
LARVFSDLSVCEYGAPGHPEAPFRVRETYARLKAAGYKLETPDVAAKPEDVALLHAPEHYESVVNGDFFDADTPGYPNIDTYALTSLSGALSAALCGEPAFSLMRPPGHHAGRSRVAGFCYFNNLALAVARLQKDGKAKRVAILDVDVHHGDGTEELMLGRANVSLTSLHQVPLYPGSGLASRGNCRNVPLPAGTGEAEYLPLVEDELSRILALKPDCLAVSAGFDTYKEDPIAGLRLEKGTYKKLGALIAQTKLPRFAVLEGGYADDLPILVEQFLDGFF